VAREPVLLALPAGHRLARLKIVPVEALAEDPSFVFRIRDAGGMKGGDWQTAVTELTGQRKLGEALLRTAEFTEAEGVLREGLGVTARGSADWLRTFLGAGGPPSLVDVLSRNMRGSPGGRRGGGGGGPTEGRGGAAAGGGEAEPRSRSS
jgi:hypothetical protein